MRYKSSFFILLVLFVLVGCSSNTEEPKANVSETSQTPKSAPIENTTQPGPADPLGPRYEATLAEGIDFRKPGYPLFIKDVRGIAGHEPWGAWTDGAIATIRFDQPLPQQFLLKVTGGAWENNINEPVSFIIGGVKRDAIFKDDPFRGPETVSLDFMLTGVNDSIQINVPAPVGGPKDTRLIGIGLISLKIMLKDGN
jgi:phosphoglycerol transferase